MTATSDGFEARIAAVRRFSRFYTRELGLLRESLVDTRFSLTEARVLYELAHREPVTASELAADLDLDHGYLSRILRRFGEDGLLKKTRAPDDGGQSLITITAKGRKAFAPLNKGSHDQVAELLGAAQRGRAGARGRRDGDGGAAARRRGGRRRSCCGRIGPATWAGSRRRTPRSTRRNTAGTSATRRWSPSITAEFIENFDPDARALLDRRDRRRARRLGVRGAQDRRDRQAAPADHRSEGARARARQAAGRGVPALRQGRGLLVA